LAESRTQARQLIEQGRVRVGGAPASKAARQVDAGEALLVEGDGPRYVGRGGEKLAAALTAFGLDPSGARALDAGASTGGFTDVLLQHGAASVVALDVGHGQLHERLRHDDRVEVLERTNLRHVDPELLGPFDVVVADLSFISLTVVMDVLVRCTADRGWLVLLVKPQFEAGRREVSRGRGVVSDPGEWVAALERVAAAAAEAGATPVDVAVSPLRGADGNVELLLHLRPGTPGTGSGAEGMEPVRDRAIAALRGAGLPTPATGAEPHPRGEPARSTGAAP
jgi:23S rRNA (cytidine1920-2'-O)/16S rRNA (cytidine1409-2'-O)-methyltransferase